ncbi:hypothetical protein [Halobacillus sp. BBL2006]|uniref:hypothetical protein n=1 Tax=Halobacillus sp. BBL2006 TaxID=1543706 RepID=UPI0005426B19|nr:hypothetical protein [Halobacillus sp. BBL2006]KHE70414.1 hypothetical protein LD39_11610 [Halobacillus sp. BBL2006]
MAEDRKQTIVQEINYWKAHRLLPNEYCDFLLALYTEGKDVPSNEGAKGNYNLPIWSLSVALTLILLPLSFLVIHFTEMDIIMQTGLLSSFVVIVCLHSLWLNYKKSFLFHVPLVIGLLIALLLTIHLLNHLLINNQFTYSTAALHGILWLWLGKRFSVRYLFISGIVLLSVLIIYLVL